MPHTRASSLRRKIGSDLVTSPFRVNVKRVMALKKKGGDGRRPSYLRRAKLSRCKSGAKGQKSIQVRRLKELILDHRCAGGFGDTSDVSHSLLPCQRLVTAQLAGSTSGQMSNIHPDSRLWHRLTPCASLDVRLGQAAADQRADEERGGNSENGGNTEDGGFGMFGVLLWGTSSMFVCASWAPIVCSPFE